MNELLKKLSELALTAKQRHDKEANEFMAFYRELVETIPSEVSNIFDIMEGIKVKYQGVDQEVGIKLTVADYIWWRGRIDNGLIPTKGYNFLRNRMIRHLADKIENSGISLDERKTLLDLVDPPVANN